MKKTIGFQVGPCLKCSWKTWRCDSRGLLYLRLLMTEVAQEVVTLMQQENAKRKQIVDDITAEALELAKSSNRS